MSCKAMPAGIGLCPMATAYLWPNKARMCCRGKRKAKNSRKSGRNSKPAEEETLDGESHGRSFIGLCLIMIGAVASLFGRFLQGVISRDREFEADSCAAGFLYL